MTKAQLVKAKPENVIRLAKFLKIETENKSIESIIFILEMILCEKETESLGEWK